MEENDIINCYSVEVGTTLTHKAFGKGKVIKIDDRLMTVSFGEAEKKFQFPDAIKNGFFKIE